MNEENPSPAKIKQGLRTGYSFALSPPGLEEAARDLIRPMVVDLKGREIICVCRRPRLLRVDSLTIHQDGFRAAGTPVHELGAPMICMENNVRSRKEIPQDPAPLSFGAG